MESCPRQALLLAGGLLALALALPLLLIAPAQAAPAAALTVCPAGPPDCGYSIVQDAVDAAQPGTTIKIAVGTYTGVNHHGGLAQVVYVDKSLTLRGGYTAPAFAEPPDPEANPTTLDALGLGRVLYVGGSIDATVEGLRITGGNAAGLGGYVAPWGTYDAGGGIYAITATVVLSANEIVSNTIPSQGDGSGGGVASLHSNVALVGNRVRGNDADRGGGLYESTSSLEANTIVSNTAGAGGGVYASEGDTTLLQTELISNTAFYGGGLYAWDGYLISNHAAFLGNIADNDGGGLFVRGSEVTLLDSDITGNTAEFSGGGLYLDQSPATLGRNTPAAGHGAVSRPHRSLCRQEPNGAAHRRQSRPFGSASDFRVSHADFAAFSRPLTVTGRRYGSAVPRPASVGRS
ncbi:MAG: right-handed parallel beta-helix repeat-containing protein, partial [Anaerolineae bacterium]